MGYLFRRNMPTDKITHQDLAEFEEAFRQFQENEPASLSSKEIADMLAFLKQSCSKAELERIRASCVKNEQADSLSMEGMIDGISDRTKITVKSEDISEILDTLTKIRMER